MSWATKMSTHPISKHRPYVFEKTFSKKIPSESKFNIRLSKFACTYTVCFLKQKKNCFEYKGPSFLSRLPTPQLIHTEKSTEVIFIGMAMVCLTLLTRLTRLTCASFPPYLPHSHTWLWNKIPVKFFESKNHVYVTGTKDVWKQMVLFFNSIHIHCSRRQKSHGTCETGS